MAKDEVWQELDESTLDFVKNNSLTDEWKTELGKATWSSLFVMFTEDEGSPEASTYLETRDAIRTFRENDSRSWDDALTLYNTYVNRSDVNYPAKFTNAGPGEISSMDDLLDSIKSFKDTDIKVPASLFSEIDNQAGLCIADLFLRFKSSISALRNELS